MPNVERDFSVFHRVLGLMPSKRILGPKLSRMGAECLTAEIGGRNGLELDVHRLTEDVAVVGCGNLPVTGT
jgi:hypothetical protein